MFPNFFGNSAAAATLEQLAASGRIPQTIMLAGPEGVGKATLARRFAAALLGDAAKIERDDLSLESNRAIVADREKWPSEKRNDDPLLFATHSDFVSFPPDGPLRQISIPQMRLVKELARYKPLHGARRVFLIDHIDRANEQAANSLLKTLEEPPEHLVIVMTAQNPYDLLPTIRSRAVTLALTPLSKEDMSAFLKSHGVDHPERRLGLAAGSPGLAVSIDLEAYDQRRAAMWNLLQAAAGQAPFGVWARHSEALGAKKSEKLDLLLGVLYLLLEDLLLLANGVREIRNSDMFNELESLAHTVTFRWLRSAVKRVDELAELVRRNIQKSLALDAFAIGLRGVKG
jgi:DNA polymerase-3 subunit delta'